jgi:hypothetical protein
MVPKKAKLVASSGLASPISAFFLIASGSPVNED